MSETIPRPEALGNPTSGKKLTTNAGAPVVANQNVMTAGPRGPALLQDIWFLEKLAHFDREVIPERRMHAKGSGAYGTFTVTHDITRFTKARIFSEIGKKTDLFARFSTVAGERGAADAERDIRGFAMKPHRQLHAGRPGLRRGRSHSAGHFDQQACGEGITPPSRSRLRRQAAGLWPSRAEKITALCTDS